MHTSPTGCGVARQRHVGEKQNGESSGGLLGLSTTNIQTDIQKLVAVMQPQPSQWLGKSHQLKWGAMGLNPCFGLVLSRESRAHITRCVRWVSWKPRAFSRQRCIILLIPDIQSYSLRLHWRLVALPITRVFSWAHSFHAANLACIFSFFTAHAILVFLCFSLVCYSRPSGVCRYGRLL